MVKRKNIQSYYPGLRFSFPILIIQGNQSKFQYAENNEIGSNSTLLITDDSTIKLGKNTWLGKTVLIEPLPGKTILIGHSTSIQDDCRLIGELSIGDNVIIAPNVFISSGTHNFKLIPWLTIREQDRSLKNNPSNNPIAIGDDCWLGTNAVIMPGVSIGNGVIVGANAVITKDQAPYTITAGVPAKVIGKRINFSPPSKIENLNQELIPYFYSGFEYDKSTSKIKWVKNKSLAVLAGGSYSRLILHIEQEDKIELRFDLLVNEKIFSNLCLEASSSNVFDISIHTSQECCLNFQEITPSYLKEFNCIRLHRKSNQQNDDMANVFVNSIELI